MSKGKLDLIKEIYVDEHEYISENAMTYSHFHNAYEIYYLAQGEIGYFINEKTYIVNTQKLVLIKPNTIHKTYFSNKTLNTKKRILINFRPDFLLNIFDSINQNFFNSLFDTYVINLTLDSSINIKNIMNKLLYEYEKRNNSDDTYLKVLLFNLLYEIKNSKSELKQNTAIYNSTLHNHISKIAIYINSNFTKNVNLELLANKFNLSKYYISRNFKNITGLTLNDYINTKRVVYSENLFKNLKLNILDIALKSGFNSINTYERAFKRIHNMTPSQYRKKDRP